jgi:pimeloyl-ACP methyl ester carboxylesterase
MTFLIMAAALIGAGAAYQLIGSARHRRRFTPPGEMIDVGGHRLHLLCSGNGSPAVVFESAIAGSSLSWSVVRPSVAEFTRACAYDRAGLGWSEAPSCPRTLDRILHDLEAVIAHGVPERRCVLVGHSFGSLVVRAYAARRPEQVAGLVLVDPPDEWLTITPERVRMLWGGRRLSKLGALLAHVGVVRACLTLLTGGAPAAPRRFVKVFGPTAARTLERLVGEVRKLPEEVHPLVQAHWSQPKCFHAMADYIRAVEQERSAFTAAVPPTEIPIAVISSRDQPPERIEAHHQLARSAEHGIHVMAQRSGHWIQFDEPDLIVRVIRDVVFRPVGG